MIGASQRKGVFTVIVKAYAKINLTLDVLGRREDGCHDLHSVMQTVSLCDVIRLQKDSEVLVSCDQPEIAPGENIAFAAANAFFAHTGIAGGATIEIDKCIPVAAGLGGGSADAAAVLCGLNDLYNAGLDYEALRRLAATLGADVPFCIEGGLALCEGKGERVTQLDALPVTAVVLARTGEKPSTGAMYARLDALRAGQPPRVADPTMLSADTVWEVAQHLSNDFLPLWQDTPAAENLEILRQYGAIGVNLTGSGPSVYGLFDDWQAAQDCADAFGRQGRDAWLCSTTE